MFSNLNFWEIAALALLGLFIFGPERLPKVIGDGVRLIRNVRDMARNATSDLSRELGTEVRIEDLHPKTFIRKHLLSEDEEQRLRRPFDEAYRDLRSIATDANSYAANLAANNAIDPSTEHSVDDDGDRGGTVGQRSRPELPASRPVDGEPRSYDQVRPYEGQPHPYEPGAAEPSRYDTDAT